MEERTDSWRTAQSPERRPAGPSLINGLQYLKRKKAPLRITCCLQGEWGVLDEGVERQLTLLQLSDGSARTTTASASCAA